MQKPLEVKVQILFLFKQLITQTRPTMLTKIP